MSAVLKKMDRKMKIGKMWSLNEIYEIVRESDGEEGTCPLS
jgi:hypothetical protein